MNTAEIPAGLSRWLQIDLDRLAANLQAVAAAVNSPVIAVVKNDAYGFGAVPVAQAFVQAGAKMLAVTTLDEAMELREGGIKVPILVFEPPIDTAAALCLAENDLTATVDGPAAAELLADVGGAACHIKVNTGMNRFGVNVADLPALLDKLAALPTVKVRGMYSHLATALEADTAFAGQQIKAFAEAKQLLLARGCTDVCCHLANSAGAFRFADARFDAVRMGSVLYAQLGLAKQYGVKLADPFAAKARIAAVRSLHKGQTVGYGREFTAPRDMQVAVIPYGYGDGFGVQPSARPATVKGSVQAAAKNLGKLALGKANRFVYCQGKPLVVLGRVAMQNMLVDITGQSLGVGDVVDVPMRRTAASARLARVYVANGSIVAVRCLSRYLQNKTMAK